MAEQSKSIPADVPWLLPESVKGSQQESLFRLLVGNERQAEFVPFGPVRVAEAFLIENAARESRKPLRWSELRLRETGEFHWEIFNRMRQKALDSIDRLLPSRHGERLFLTREQKIRPFNQKEIADIAVEFGFVPVDPSSLSAVEQVKLFADAKFIVSSTGAQWSGLVFAERARCLTLIPEFLFAHTVFSKLAALGESTIFELEMESSVREWRRFRGTQVDSKVDPLDFRKSLEDLLSLD